MIVQNKTLHRLINRPAIKRFLTDNRWVAAQYFNYLYRSPDPYRLSSEPERAKFRRAFDLVEGRRFRSALEIGCGEGVNAPRLADFCDRVLAMDISRTAIERAIRSRPHPRVDYRVFDLVEDRLDGRYDYVFCSETLVYLSRPQLERGVRALIDATAAGGVIHLIHCRSVHDDESGLYNKPYGARTIHALFLNDARLRSLHDEQTADYRITLLERPL